MMGRYERRIRSLILEGRDPIEVNWLGMSPQEAEDGGADRCTDILVAAGYRPSGRDCALDVQEAYITGQKVDGKYIRLPQETWIKKGGE